MNAGLDDVHDRCAVSTTCTLVNTHGGACDARSEFERWEALRAAMDLGLDGAALAAAVGLHGLVPVFPFHRPFGGLVVDGIKDETRGRPWPFAGPRWIAVYNAQKVAKLQPAAAALAGAAGYVRPLLRDRNPIEQYQARIGSGGTVLGLAFITGSLPIVPGDLRRTFHYEEELHVWSVEMAVRFKRPLAPDKVGLKKPPRNFVYVAASALVDALKP